MKRVGRTISPADLIKELPSATATASQYKDHTDPKYTGPGTWNMLHRLAFKARDSPSQLNYIAVMKETCYGFNCVVCRGHCTEYIKNHPLEEYLGTKITVEGKNLDLGMFVWTWKFHNAVNARLQKPIMSWVTAYNLYSETQNLVCSKSCLEDNTLGKSLPATSDKRTSSTNRTPIRQSRHR